MASNSMDVIVERRLRWHKTETILLWLIIAIVAILIPTGIGIYLYVGNLSIAEYVFSVPPGNLAIFQGRYPRASPWHLSIRASLDALRRNYIHPRLKDVELCPSGCLECYPFFLGA